MATTSPASTPAPKRPHSNPYPWRWAYILLGVVFFLGVCGYIWKYNNPSNDLPLKVVELNKESTLASENATLRTARQGLEKANSDLRTKNFALDRSVKELEATKATLTDEKSRLVGMLQERERNLVAARSEATKLRTELARRNVVQQVRPVQQEPTTILASPALRPQPQPVQFWQPPQAIPVSGTLPLPDATVGTPQGNAFHWRTVGGDPCNPRVGCTLQWGLSQTGWSARVQQMLINAVQTLRPTSVTLESGWRGWMTWGKTSPKFHPNTVASWPAGHKEPADEWRVKDGSAVYVLLRVNKCKNWGGFAFAAPPDSHVPMEPPPRTGGVPPSVACP
jgi:hypothetical protein